MKGWKVTVTVTIILAIIGILGAAWTVRPIVDYYMSGIQDSYQSSTYTPLKVGLNFKNRGGIDALLHLVVRVTDANITVDELEPWIDCNGTQAVLNVNAQMHMENSATYYVNILPIGNPENFTITYTIEDVSGFSINGVISHLFLERTNYYPTYAVYNQTSGNVYQLVK
jgi:hypothetical protein